MKQTLYAYLVLLAVTAILSVGCVVTCTNPPFDINKAMVDEDLLGGWLVLNEEGEIVEFRRAAGETIDVFITKRKERRGPIFNAYSAQEGARRYLWLVLLEKGKTATDDGHILVRYEVKGDKAVLWLLDRDKVKAAVTEGKLKGRSIGGEGEVRLSGPTEEVAAAVRDEHFWKKDLELKRVIVK